MPRQALQPRAALAALHTLGRTGPGRAVLGAPCRARRAGRAVLGASCWARRPGRAVLGAPCWARPSTHGVPWPRRPDAGFLTTSDHLGNTTNGQGLESHNGIHTAFNIGYMFFRGSALPLVEEWVKVRVRVS